MFLGKNSDRIVGVIIVIACLGSIPLAASSLSRVESSLVADCNGNLSTAVPKSLVPDTQRKSIPLFLENAGYMGYEFMQYNPPEKENLDNFRQWLNNPPKRSTLTLPENGLIDLRVTGKRGLAPTEEDIESVLKKAIPSRFVKVNFNFVKSAYMDCLSRGYPVRSINISFRTEKSGGFGEGHNHLHDGAINYSRAAIGRNTEVDSHNRFQPSTISDSDYIKTEDPSSVLIFGDIWHRTPPQISLAPRQFTIVSCWMW